MSIEEIPHTADIKLRIRAASVDEIFSEALRGLMSIMYGTKREGGESKTIQIEGGDRDKLLRDFLSEVLFISEVEGLVFSEGTISIKGESLLAVLKGEDFNSLRHSGGTGVKGISYTGLEIQETDDGYQVDIVFDV